MADLTPEERGIQKGQRDIALAEICLVTLGRIPLEIAVNLGDDVEDEERAGYVATITPWQEAHGSSGKADIPGALDHAAIVDLPDGQQGMLLGPFTPEEAMALREKFGEDRAFIVPTEDGELLKSASERARKERGE